MRAPILYVSKNDFYHDQNGDVEDDEDEEYRKVWVGNNIKLLNKTTIDDIERIRDGPLYEQYPRGVFAEEVKANLKDFNDIFIYGYDGGPYTEDEKVDEGIVMSGSQPEFNIFFEETYGANLKDMKMVEAMNRREDNLTYDEPKFTISVVGNVMRDYEVHREQEIGRVLRYIFGDGTRYVLDLISSEEINEGISKRDHGDWYGMRRIIPGLSENSNENVNITVVRNGIHPYTFHEKTALMDVFDLMFLDLPYHNYFMFRDIRPVSTDVMLSEVR